MENASQQRRRWTDEEKRALVQRWESSGLSARDFGAREGVPFANLWNWKSLQRKSVRTRKPREVITFSPARVKEAAAVGQAEHASTEGVSAEIALEGGIRIRVFSGADMREVSELVGALSRRPSC